MKKIVFIILFLFLPMTVLAQEGGVVVDDVADPSPNAVSELGSNGQATDQSSASRDVDASQAEQSPYADSALTPREVYNLARRALERGEFELAADGFIRARDKAAYDNELRFSAAYNLAYTHALMGDVLGDPQALDADGLNALLLELERSIAWFRDAVRQRPGDVDARENLEVVLRRALLVKDILTQKYYGLEKQLDELAGLQREIRESARTLSDRLTQEGEGHEPLAFQDDFRALASQQRAALTQANWVAENAVDATKEIEAQPEQARSQEDSYRLFQLTQVQPLLDLARQTMAKARRQMRELSLDDSLRLSNQSFYLVQQAREQLQEPLNILRQRVADQTELIQLMAARVSLEDPEVLAAMAEKSAGQMPKPPAWLNFELLSDTQNDGLVRTQRLAALFKATLDGHSQQKMAAAQAEPETSTQDAEAAERQIEQIKEALPLIDESIASMQGVISAIALGSVENGLEPAGRALEALSLAAERFADLKHLIELAYATQVQVSDLLLEAKTLEAHDSAAAPDELFGIEGLEQRQRPLKTLMAKNLLRNHDRLERLATLLAMQASQSIEAASQGPQAGQTQGAAVSDPAAAEEKLQEIQQLYEHAERLRQRAATHVEQALARFERTEDVVSEDLVEGESVTLDAASRNASLWEALVEPTTVAKVALSELRILFFSIVEHVEELLREQTQTLDSTTDIASLDSEDLSLTLMPVVERQRRHEVMADTLSDALTEQAKQMQSGMGAEGVDPQALEERSGRFLQAADELKLAATAMRQVNADLQTAEPLFDPAIQGQGQAVEHIGKALALLKDPQTQASNEQQQDKQDQQEQEMSKEQAEKKIQQIRSREQERRKVRDSRLPEMPVVDKDW